MGCLGRFEYDKWIIDNGLTLPSNASGRCKEAVHKMQYAFPELTICKGLVCGVSDGFENKYPHWWLKTAQGEIVDPTISQFDFLGNLFYKEAQGEPTGRCCNCGDLCYNGETCCSSKCYKSYTNYVMGRELL